METLHKLIIKRREIIKNCEYRNRRKRILDYGENISLIQGIKLNILTESS